MTKGRGGGRSRFARAWSAVAVCVPALTGCSAQAVADDGGGGTGGGTDGSSAGTGTADPTGRPDPKPSATPPEPLPGARIDTADGQTVGVGMPISVTFDRPIPVAERADVERRLKVGAEVEGVWGRVRDRGLLDGQRVDFRPRTYWKPGTAVTVRAGAGITRHFTVGRSPVATVDVGNGYGDRNPTWDQWRQASALG